MKIGYISWTVVVLFVGFAACKDSKKASAEKLVTEWIGKEIIFPPGSDCSKMGEDTPCPNLSHTPYKVLVYTDSVGCTSCRLNLHVWKAYMEEIDTLASGKVDFLFYFQPKNRKELDHLLKRDKFEHTVFIDEKGEISQINNFPEEMEYQSFLLDRENNVLSVGNPVMNTKMWEVYKQVITSTHE
ncbi:hypothetical protein [Parapedobacter koreensis]|uniref:AhpC/TSA family protein n=1 Tax=Parapedobacter koreensis TaxID=332977 RepID=A0A1H7F0X0_9SPHI|nr:hypothetical protein [Parapedobacter koreensis]SEK19796.1 hypothetical protein SAMN05421740_101175 [Parapedobacter koreensis]